MSVNRTELVAQIAERANLTKVEADASLGAFQDVLVESLQKGEAVKVTGLFSVERVERAARTGRNPRTREEIQIPAGYGVKLSAGSTLKKAVSNKGVSLPSTSGTDEGRAPERPPLMRVVTAHGLPPARKRRRELNERSRALRGGLRLGPSMLPR